MHRRDVTGVGRIGEAGRAAMDEWRIAADGKTRLSRLNSWRFSGHPARLRRPAPSLGAKHLDRGSLPRLVQSVPFSRVGSPAVWNAATSAGDGTSDPTPGTAPSTARIMLNPAPSVC